MPKRNRVTNDSGHKKIQKRAIPLLLSCITTFPLFSVQSSANSGIDVYPPNWWVGMQNSNVELMLYGDDVADDTVSIKMRYSIRYKLLFSVFGQLHS